MKLRREPVATGAALAVVLTWLVSQLSVPAEVRAALVTLALGAIAWVVRACVSPVFREVERRFALWGGKG
jgi:hypothetical protein